MSIVPVTHTRKEADENMSRIGSVLAVGQHV